VGEYRYEKIWLKSHNKKVGINQSCGIFGLDLYSLHLSMEKVVEYLNVHDKEMTKTVKEDYSVLGKIDPQIYGMLVNRNLMQGCQDAVNDALEMISLRTEAFEEHKRNGLVAIEDAFMNEMNARVVVGAKQYYRGMFDPKQKKFMVCMYRSL
jgi:erythromycin esterase-like protein